MWAEFLWVVMDDLCLSNFLELFDDDHKGNDAFAIISHLCPNVMEESVSGPSPCDHDCSWVYPRYEEHHEKVRPE